MLRSDWLFFFAAGNCTSNLRVTRSRWRRWEMKHRPARNRRAKLPPAESAIKPSLPTAVATSVLIAKPSSVHAVGDEFHYAPTRYGHNVPQSVCTCCTNISWFSIPCCLRHIVQYIYCMYDLLQGLCSNHNDHKRAILPLFFHYSVLARGDGYISPETAYLTSSCFFLRSLAACKWLYSE